MVCSNSAREIAGEMKSAGEVFDKVVQDKMFYDASGGGVTISGGEVMMYPEFASAFFALCRNESIHTAIESCMFASRTVVDKVMKFTDLALCDIKHMDSKKHKQCTGVENKIILENIAYVKNVLKKTVIVRTPAVIGMNADDENIEQTARFIAEKLGRSTPYQLLPYHNLGESKLQSLGKTASLGFAAPDDSFMLHLKELAEMYLDDIQIGGD